MRCTWFTSPMIYQASSIFDHAHPIIIKITFPSWITADFRVLSPNTRVATPRQANSFLTYMQTLESQDPFLTTPTPIFSNQLLISMKLYQYAKKQAFSSFCSKDIVDLKNPAIWLTDSILAHISGTRFFPNIGFQPEYSK